MSRSRLVPFNVVYADPPWKFDNRGSRASPDYNLRTGTKKRLSAAYTTMTLDDVCAMPVESIVGDNALLALWAPWAMLLGTGTEPSPAMRVCASWGFVPKSAVPWVKGRWDDEDPDRLRLQIGLGNYVRVATEVLVIATRGKFKVPPANRVPGVLSPRGRHSAKPEAGRRLVETLAEGPRAELFSRTDIEGWSAWGNEAPNPDPFLCEALGYPIGTAPASITESRSV